MSTGQLKPSQVAPLRAQLVTQQQELTELLKNTGEATGPVMLDQQSVGRVSRIDAIQQQQMAIASQQQASDLLKRIELALRRIDAGDFGDCLQCNEPIAYARLQAQPFASLCIDCQTAREVD
ncbi:MAG: TraR/DksA family transcriptional regulator [Gammaproteobacteria bacterium]|nr:TraR/DksA family transcriptional regulator [Gammaproteobacteria bacterium]